MLMDDTANTRQVFKKVIFENLSQLFIIYLLIVSNIVLYLRIYLKITSYVSSIYSRKLSFV